MFFGKRRKKAGLTRAESMRALPVRNQALEWRYNEEGELEITIKRREDWVGKLFAAVFFVPKTRTLVLEPPGPDVWELCDGEHSVEEIARALQKKYKLERREAEVSLTEYLRRLGKKRLIAFALPQTEAASTDE